MASLVSLFAFSADQSYANDELQSAVSALAMVAAKIHVISLNCMLEIDPYLETRIVEIVSPLPDVSLSDVSMLLIRRLKNELAASGTTCESGAKKHITTLNEIYDHSIDGLENAVTVELKR